MESSIDEPINNETYPSYPRSIWQSSASSIRGISNVGQSSHSLDTAGLSVAPTYGLISRSFLTPHAAGLRPAAINSIPRNTPVTEMEHDELLERLQTLSVTPGAGLILPYATQIPVDLNERRGSSSSFDINIRNSYPVRPQSQFHSAFNSHSLYPNWALNGMANHNSFVPNQNALNLYNSQLSTVRFPMNTEANGHGDSYEGSNWHDVDRFRNEIQINAQRVARFGLRQSAISPEMKMYIYNLAKDQNICPHLQDMVLEGNPRGIALIFHGIIDHLPELMVNSYGSSLIYKMVKCLTNEQRKMMVAMLSKDPNVFIRVAQNADGVKPLKLLIESIKTEFEANLIQKAVMYGFYEFIQDVNSSNVLQSCLNTFTPKYNEPIIDATAQNCIEFAMHQHACRVLVICINISTGDVNTKMLAEISAHGLPLAKHSYGNYTVQTIIQLRNPMANAILIQQLKNNYVDLSMQKFSSNVVERCIQFYEKDDRARLILELASSSEFKLLLQDQFANYVIQTALVATKDSPLHSLLVHAIRPHAEALKACQFFKRINKHIWRN